MRLLVFNYDNYVRGHAKLSRDDWRFTTPEVLTDGSPFCR